MFDKQNIIDCLNKVSDDKIITMVKHINNILNDPERTPTLVTGVTGPRPATVGVVSTIESPSVRRPLFSNFFMNNKD